MSTQTIPTSGRLKTSGHAVERSAEVGPVEAAITTAPAVEIYDGLECLVTVRTLSGCRQEATDAAGQDLGIFPSGATATAAVLAARGRA